MGAQQLRRQRAQRPGWLVAAAAGAAHREPAGDLLDRGWIDVGFVDPGSPRNTAAGPADGRALLRRPGAARRAARGGADGRGRAPTGSRVAAASTGWTSGRPPGTPNSWWWTTRPAGRAHHRRRPCLDAARAVRAGRGADLPRALPPGGTAPPADRGGARLGALGRDRGPARAAGPRRSPPSARKPTGGSGPGYRRRRWTRRSRRARAPRAAGATSARCARRARPAGRARKPWDGLARDEDAAAGGASA